MRGKDRSLATVGEVAVIDKKRARPVLAAINIETIFEQNYDLRNILMCDRHPNYQVAI